MLKVVDKLWKQNERRKTKSKPNNYIQKTNIWKKYIVIYIHTHDIHEYIEWLCKRYSKTATTTATTRHENNVKMCIHYENRKNNKNLWKVNIIIIIIYIVLTHS